ncbi:cubilin [Molossus molossus]|uniref:Cubilin n=1 Tax=Molossus molossus TaxID=27622 RepID=A0A7J8JRY0_MOLMO|nr:cubilin [Molossus molossus]KAF6499664.1 cubilin [Molossus molossus]
MSSSFLWCMVILLTFAESHDEAGRFELQRQKRNADLQQPRMATERGNLVFLTGSAQNIEFKTGSLGKIKLNDEDLGECLHQIQKNKDDITDLKRSAVGLPQNISSEIHQLNSKFVDLERKFQSLQQTVDRKVCGSNPCQNGGTCLNLHDSFFCICPSQWKGPLCSVDVNECEVYSGTPFSCQNGATCINTAGSYSCRCSPDTHGPQCASKYNDCEGGSQALCVHGICEDQVRVQDGQPRYSCICDAGWTSPENSSACTLDMDECSLWPAPCSALVQCFNTPGSYHCGACPAGWKGNGYDCQDINECEINNGGCSVAPPVECVNTPGSYHCRACPPGYQGDGRVCTLVDACSVNNGGCHPQASCSSVPGFLPLCTCLPGYTGNGFGPNGCVQLSNICLSRPCLNGQCTDTVSGYLCKCDSGWAGINCTENINECLSSPCLNGGTCVDGINAFSCECTRFWTGPLCQTPQQVCGGSLSGLNGSFTYKSPDVGYVHDVNCFWVVRTEERKVLRITFTFFQLEPVSTCPHEFLQIHDGASSAAFSLGRFCGSSAPQELRSSDNALYFHFHSEHLKNDRGFTIIWATQQPECGGVLTGTYGSITSPGYPGNYPPGRDCVWRVITSPGLVITFTFGTLSLEHHDDCSRDYLEIRDGPLSQDPVLGKFCTTRSVPPLRTTGPFARIHFHSDNQINDQGFHITYLTSPLDPHCGGNYTDPEGPLSLELSGPFTYNKQCIYIITQPLGEQIQVNFTHVELEGQSGCSQSYIEVRDDDTLLGKVCGSETLSHIKSITNSIWIRFIIDASVVRAGFRAVYQVACGGELTGEGVIRSPFYPNAYPGERICRWTIQQPQGQVVLLNFTGFEIGSSSQCNTDYIEIGSSSILGSTENKKYCGTDIPMLITSMYNFLYVIFVKSSSTENRGFMAKFRTEDLACGKTLTEPTGTIESPGHPNIYPHGINCTWYILTQPGYLINLIVRRFHLQFHYNCTNDYLEIYDTGSGTSLGRYCGKSFPPSLTSNSNSLMLVFVADADLAYEGFLINYETTNASAVCLEDYTEESGTFTSPNFPSNYPNNWKCVYRITVGTSQQIALHFTNFSLEGAIGGECIGDFVEIKDGGYETSPSRGKYCGSDLPPRIISHSNKLWVQFQSDVFDSRSGFSAYWDGSLTGCGGNLTTPTGTFTSPNYPMPYYHSSDCSWLLRSSHGSPFELEFEEFHLEHHPDCTADYLAVYDGPSTSSHLLTQLCGNEKPPLIRSSGDSMFLKLRTDEGQQGGGFLAKYQQTCENVRIVNQTYGILESIHHPNPYADNQRCNWTIQATTGNTVNYTFLEFDLEDHINCSTDYLELYDGSRRMGRYCGKERPPSGSTAGSILRVLFHTDGVGHVEKGFRMQWFIHGCGAELSGASGSFSSPGYPNTYPPSKECIWYIHTAPGSSIQLTIHDFDVEYHESCHFDVLEIYGGPDFHSPRIAQLCARRSSENPMQVSSTGNELAIRFKTDSFISGRGFNVSWQAIPGGCGGIFQAPSGEIHSPNYPSPYRSNTDCSWVIRVEKHHRVLLNFTDFDLEPQDSCIIVYDGVSSATTRLARGCGRQQLTSPITSSANSLFVRFQSGPSRQSRGFRAHFRQVCGGYILTNSLGTISSPLFPAKYPDNQNCSWIIQAQPPFNHITLSFTHFGLESSTNCSGDVLEVLDGNYDDAPLRGRYCGNSMPQPITSFSRALTLRFVSDSSLNSDGFHATYTASSSACGGDFHMAEGTLNSPGYPEVYPSDVECVWNIVSSPGNRLQLSFITFQLEESQDCRRDFVEIRKENATGHLVGRYCGNALPLTSPSLVAHSLWIRFVSDASGTGTGFQATFASIFGNDNIVGTHGKVASPLWPGNYPHNSDYRWTVNVNASQVVQGQILEMDIESTHNCHYDKLRIYDGAGIHSRPIGTYCGTQIQSFSSTGNSLTFQFSSDASISGKGFLLEWFARNAAAGPLPTIATGACGGFLRTGEAPVFLFSPGWPENYGNHADCTWLLQAPDSTVELNILSLDIESHGTCNYDKLVIRDGDNNMAQQLAILCGREIPGPIRSTGEYMWIRFTSDFSVTRAGFNASFHKSCGGYLHANRGIITSPNYPETYPPNLNCSWHVLVPSGLTIAVHFEQPFQIPNTDSCNQGDYLVLKNGPDISSPPLGPHGGNGHFCGSRPSSTLFTSDNQMFVQFISDHRVGGQGFKIKYEAQSLACGGNIYIHDADSVGYVTSPNHPDNYPRHADCIWLLAAPSGKLIRLQFEDQFSIEFTPNCTSNYLELRDGADSNAPVISKFCGTSLPGSQLSSGEVIYLRFRSDNSSTHVGFKAKYSIAQCWGTLTGQSGVIQSVGYPTRPYSDDLFCEWHLRGISGHYLTIHFEDFNLQNSSGCEKDFVEIWENHASGNLLGRYCGNIIPDSIDTSSNVALVRFVTDGSLTASGFSLRFESSLEECGGDLQGPTGTFTSPNYPNPNPHGRICEWRIAVQEGKQVTLTFHNLRLEAHPSCNSERVTVFNGIRSNSPQLGKLCSSGNVSDEIRSSGNTMKVVYFTDGSRPYGGFAASYTSSEDAVCGGSLTNSPGGNFTSPGYNGVSNYSRNLNCEWTVSNPNQGNSSIYIHFEDFYLESHQDCQFDVLEFRVGNADGPLIWRFCGRLSSAMPLVIPYPQVWIHFVTNERVEHIGFHAEYFFTDCGGLQTGESGVIASPNYPASYDSLTHCAWLLEVPQGHTITLTFSDFDIEDHFTCAWDSVTVRNGGSPGSPIIGQYCGSSNPSPIQSGSNQLVVIFNSDHSVQNGGFYATWSTHTLGCGGILHSDNGTIRSPHWPQNFPENSRCSWTVITHESNHLEISFDNNFLIPSGDGQCQNSFVKVWAGTEAVDKALLATSCGNLAPGAIITPRNAFTAVFQSQEAPAQGFSASFVSRCGSHFTKSSGYIISPNYPKQYDNNMNCTYFIEADPLSVVFLTFVSFHLEARSAVTGSCDSDGVHIIRGHSVASTPFATMCGDEIPSPVTISGPVLLNFYSNSHTTDFGFKLSYQITSCGGVFNFSSGLIRSPAYSYSDYPNDLYCLYNITVRDHKVILLKFIEFDVVLSTSCSQDYLAIYDGDDISDPLLGQFCGSRLPPHVKSSNNSMLLVFKTDSFQTARGWMVSFRQTLGPQQGCGGYLTGSDHTFASPDSDSHGRYDKHLNCIWFIIAPVNKLIKLTFNTFALESAFILQGCFYDYVKLYDGQSENAKLVGTFCGSSVPAPFVSSGNFLTVQFVSDGTVEREGFNATYTFIDMTCGGTYNATWTPQNISSPNLSNPDAPLSTCTWVFEAPPHQQVEITVWALQLSFQDCHRNYLEFQDAPESDGNPRIHFCGRNASAVPTFYSSTTTAVVMFRFEVSSNNSRVGFTYQIAGCNRDYNKAFGNLRSPGWPGDYSSNVDCTVTLTAPQNHTISLFFHSFGVEDSSECRHDFLEVRDGRDSSSPLLGTYCGALLPSPVFSRNHELYLRFRSDGAASGHGYEIIWTSSPSGCGGTLYGDHGSFTSPGYPGTYPNNTHCEWAIIAPAGRHVTVSFYFISIDDPGDCVQNYLILYDGPDVNSPPAGPYCGTDTNIAPFVASSHRVFVEFHAAYAARPSAIQLTWDS